MQVINVIDQNISKIQEFYGEKDNANLEKYRYNIRTSVDFWVKWIYNFSSEISLKVSS